MVSRVVSIRLGNVGVVVARESRQHKHDLQRKRDGHHPQPSIQLVPPPALFERSKGPFRKGQDERHIATDARAYPVARVGARLDAGEHVARGLHDQAARDVVGRGQVHCRVDELVVDLVKLVAVLVHALCVLDDLAPGLLPRRGLVVLAGLPLRRRLRVRVRVLSGEKDAVQAVVESPPPAVAFPQIFAHFFVDFLPDVGFVLVVVVVVLLRCGRVQGGDFSCRRVNLPLCSRRCARRLAGSGILRWGGSCYLILGTHLKRVVVIVVEGSRGQLRHVRG